MKDIVPDPEETMPSAPFQLVFSSQARVGELYNIFFVNLLYSILTLGVFRFWARTRTRRYIFSRMNLLGDGFEYTGTGGELFKGFLIVFFLILLPFGILPQYFMESIILSNPALGVGLSVSQGLFFAALFPVAIFRTNKYLLSRVNWRGIRFSQTGATFGYWWRWVVLWVLMPLTLGLIYPVRDKILTSYLVNNARFGSQAFSMHMKSSHLYPAFFIAIVTAIVALVFVHAIIGFAFLDEFKLLFEGFKDEEGQSTIKPIFAIKMTFLLFGMGLLSNVIMLMAKSIYDYYFLSEAVAYSKLGVAGFRAEFTYWAYTKFSLVNIFLMIISLGLAYPFIVCRYMNFISRYLETDGLESFEKTIQIERDELKAGEGLADAMDVGVF